MGVTQIFLLFFRNSFFFVYWHSDLEGSCLNGIKSRHVIEVLLATLIMVVIKTKMHIF